ncbi:ferrous iron transport protein B [Pyrofollis japonicus]|uniref:ferrous iron transport protein B n=1 Tax=Pyrofollis japonicus TaxID=3060460 RepID=UPI00295BE698|nr:ferrous iron transport protein B [Pyrofollis japonicus]BEP17089.1 ferrous iron transport protein B [Pyrofollis japonicus]
MPGTHTLRRGSCDYIVALLGAPNTGKTTLFNVLTGSSEFVANWPGVTVAVKTAVLRLNNKRYCIIDLPGTYSILGDTAEERVTRDFLFKNQVDAIIVLADATNLERGLYLPLEVMQIFDNVIIVLTKGDEAEKKGLQIDVEGLSKELGVPVVLVSALEGWGINEILQTLQQLIEQKALKPSPKRVRIPSIEEPLNKIVSLLRQEGISEKRAKWIALALLRGYEWPYDFLRSELGKRAEKIISELRRIVKEVEAKGVDLSIEIPKALFDEASRLYESYVRASEYAAEVVPQISLLDRLLLNPVTGPIISALASIAIIFTAYLIATGSPLDILLDYLGFHKAAEIVSEYNLVNLVAMFMDWIASLVESNISNPIIERMLGEGLLSSSYGVGLVVSFLPLVAVMMLILGLLEDSGILARLAVGFDPIFRRFGVSGKALFPMLVSFGCNVPGVLSTRIMEGEEERRAVMFALPFIPCQARLVVILAFAHVYFSNPLERALAVFIAYAVPIAAFLLTIKLFAVMKGVEPFEIALELPPVKRPSIKVAWWFTWDKIKHFLVRAGTIIAVASIILWVLANYGPNGYLHYSDQEYDPSKSYAASIGRAMAPYVELMIGTNESLAWRIGFGLLGGFLAKEVFLDSLAAVSPASIDNEEEFATLKAYPLEAWQALALLLAVTLYVPCVATMGAIYSESRSIKFTTAVIAYDLVIATLAALLVRAIALLI